MKKLMILGLSVLMAVFFVSCKGTGSEDTSGLTVAEKERVFYSMVYGRAAPTASTSKPTPYVQCGIDQLKFSNTQKTADTLTVTVDIPAKKMQEYTSFTWKQSVKSPKDCEAFHEAFAKQESQDPNKQSYRSVKGEMTMSITTGKVLKTRILAEEK